MRGTCHPRRAAWALALLAVGCVAPSDGEVARDPIPIVDGTRETGEPAVVFIYNDYGAGCTASVISPRVVLTAKHCVMDMPARAWHVIVGPSIWSYEDEYGVTETRASSGSSIENQDIGLLILGRDFEQGLKRWEFTPWPGFDRGVTITAIGYGQTSFEDPESAGTKYRRDGVVRLVGPAAAYQLGDREFLTQGENTCQGDSGGPLLYQDVVVGITSRGEEGCTGIGWMTRVSGFYDFVAQALRDTGGCVPAHLETCNGVDDDCWNGADDGLSGCACSGGGGPSGEVCDGVDNDCNEAIDDLDRCGCTGGAAPTTEVCDGVDNDCNGQVDEVCRRLGESCSVDSECSSGLCGDVGGSRVCTAVCTAGPGSQCPEGGYCDAAVCGQGLCRPLSGSRRVGESCGNSGECASGYCAPREAGGSVCSHACTPGGMECWSTEVCAVLGIGCGGCETPEGGEEGRAFGEPCEEGTQCASGLCFVDGDGASCGEGCTYRYCATGCGPSGECPGGGHCRGGTCVRGPASGLGQTCVEDGDCVEGRCYESNGVRRCVVDCTPEGGCTAGFYCLSGVVNGVCWPEGVLPGDGCAVEGEGCVGGQCVFVGGRLVCGSRCDGSDECTAGLSCVGLGGWGFCIPSTIPAEVPDDDDDEPGCGCAAAGAEGPDAGWLVLLVPLALLVSLMRRRVPSGASVWR